MLNIFYESALRSLQDKYQLEGIFYSWHCSNIDRIGHPKFPGNQSGSGKLH